MRDSARNLRNFDGMRQAIAKMVGITRGKYLRFGFQTPEGSRMNDAVAIARIFAAIAMLGFSESPATGIFRVHGPTGRRQRSFRERFCGWDEHSYCPPSSDTLFGCWLASEFYGAACSLIKTSERRAPIPCRLRPRWACRDGPFSLADTG